MIATDPYLGVKPSDTYLCYVILSPVGAYYKGGFSPVKIWISDEYVRAALGGTGEAKTGGNYAASLKASMEAAAPRLSTRCSGSTPSSASTWKRSAA